MRILAGTCLRQSPEVLAAHLQTMRWQSLPHGVSLDLAYVDDSLESERDLSRSHLLGANARILEAPPRPDGATYQVTSSTHEWAIPTFHHLARAKQSLIELALADGYDALWLVDSDLLCSPDTLSSLLSTGKEIVSGVFWTRWTPTEAPLPQVWLTHPYGFDGAGWTQTEFLRALHARELVKVRGLGACTLISRHALERGAGFWPLVEGLPSGGMWQGEDRHFCIRAERLHLEMWADAWPRIFHCYRPEQRTQLDAAISHLAHGPPEVAGLGDWISCTIEPCEEPALALHREHIRGRLGLLKVVPEVETALHGMKVGDSKFVVAHFDASHPLPQYRNQRRTLRVTLHSARAP